MVRLNAHMSSSVPSRYSSTNSSVSTPSATKSLPMANALPLTQLYVWKIDSKLAPPTTVILVCRLKGRTHESFNFF